MVLDPTARRLTDEEVDKARALWSQYERTHQVSDRHGETAGIDPLTERIWFGDSILDVVHKREAEGEDSPLFFVRVGYEYYFRKGGRR